MKKFIAMAVAVVFGLSLSVVGAQPAGACHQDDGQVAGASVESKAAGQSFEVGVGVDEDGDYPVSVGYEHTVPFQAHNCSDWVIEYLEEDPVGAVEETIGVLLIIIESLLP